VFIPRDRLHWPEYLIEAAALGTFMASATVFATLFQHPGSPLSGFVDHLPLRRLPMGLAMGLTAVALIYSPIGRRSGAHINPAVTLTFLRLGKIAGIDAAGYVAAQFTGGLLGLASAVWMLRGLPSDSSVNFIATTPGAPGATFAFGAELAMSFTMMLTVLRLSNDTRLAKFTGLAAGVLVALYITVEAPVSGMSLNPARTLPSALLAHTLDSLWIYFTAPPLGMLLAAELLVRTHGPAGVRCAKLHHSPGACIFNCGYRSLPAEAHT
jgi:aquaporin Z